MNVLVSSSSSIEQNPQFSLSAKIVLARLNVILLAMIVFLFNHRSLQQVEPVAGSAGTPTQKHELEPAVDSGLVQQESALDAAQMAGQAR